MVKQYTLRVRQKDIDIFRAVQRGRKRVETRAATKRYKNVQKGEFLRFVCGKNKCLKKVKRARYFKSVAGLLRTYRLKDIYPNAQSAKELKALYNRFPKYQEQIKKFGIVAMEL